MKTYNTAYKPPDEDGQMLEAREAQQRLREGNQRFLSGIQSGRSMPDRSRRAELIRGQHPFAIILGCSDSRVPPELVFDQGPGDLFVVRVAGNIAAPTQRASVEFAALRFGTRLVVVLGHSQCGAVLATLEDIEGASDEKAPRTNPIVDVIRPTVTALLNTAPTHDREALVRHAVRANVEASVRRLRCSESLKPLIEEDGLVVIGAVYALETGKVEFFDDQAAG